MTTSAPVALTPDELADHAASVWARALQVIELLAANPFGLGGACIRARVHLIFNLLSFKVGISMDHARTIIVHFWRGFFPATNEA